jgi:hypothetical protein
VYLRARRRLHAEVTATSEPLDLRRGREHERRQPHGGAATVERAMDPAKLGSIAQWVGALGTLAAVGVALFKEDVLRALRRPELAVSIALLLLTVTRRRSTACRGGPCFGPQTATT